MGGIIIKFNSDHTSDAGLSTFIFNSFNSRSKSNLWEKSKESMERYKASCSKLISIVINFSS